MKYNNKGISLIELIAGIVILVIVITLLFQFLIHGSKMYTRVSSEVKLQYRAQMVMNQIEDKLVDISMGVCVDTYYLPAIYYTTEPSTESAQYSMGGMTWDSKDAEYNIGGFQWNPYTKEITYITTDGIKRNNNLYYWLRYYPFCQNVEDFSVEVTQQDTQKNKPCNTIVTCTLTLRYGRATTTITRDITLRNAVTVCPTYNHLMETIVVDEDAA